jgi:hypothetical protein
LSIAKIAFPTRSMVVSYLAPVGKDQKAKRQYPLSRALAV